jgi:RNA polymerase sigma-70 factor (ECF subfamily)
MDTATRQSTFDSWLREHAAILHHVANGFATGADRQDLFQELMLALWRAIPAFRATSRPSTFIFRVTHNAALTWKRAERGYRQRVARYQQEQLDLPVVNRASDSDEPADTLELLYAAIRTLEPVDRSLVLLQLDGVSYAHIAEIHGFTESNVGVRLNRIKHRLTAIFQEKTT